MALRQRLNETVDALDALRNENTALQVQYEAQTKDLTIARSDSKLICLLAFS